MNTARERRVSDAMQERSRGLARREPSGSASHAPFLGVSALLFAASAAATIVWCRSMFGMGTPSAMREMSMPGERATSMIWEPMSGQSWTGAAASFTGVWAVMMIAMMLPSVTPLLWRYRRAVEGTGEPRLDALSTSIAAGYFLVWTVLGAAIFPFGTALTTAEMHLPALARVVPTATGIVLMIAGAVQFTSWKSCHLACCREVLLCGRILPVDPASAWRHGLRYGLHCAQCCASLMAVLLALGVMDLRAMALITTAITAERLAPDGVGVARATGAIAMASGLVLLARATGLA
jgi:predicted metal-binding membrane protein